MIRAIIETSLIDWDGKISMVLFFDKCNFMCPFCQNWDLILNPEKFPVIAWDEIKKKLIKKKKWIDGVVLTGGEPLFDKKEIFEIAKNLKEMNLGVKIDTNGAYPDALKELIDAKLIDYVAMDVKAPLNEEYSIAVGKNNDLEKIKESIRILMSNEVEYEFRTTCVPGIINEQAIHAIGEVLRGAKLWALQAHVPQNAYKEEYRKELDRNYNLQLQKFADIAKKYASNVILRGKTY